MSPRDTSPVRSWDSYSVTFRLTEVVFPDSHTHLRWMWSVRTDGIPDITVFPPSFPPGDTLIENVRQGIRKQTHLVDDICLV